MLKSLVSKNSLFLLLLASAIFLIYYPTAHYSFINFDDNAYITDNPHVQSGLTYENIKWAFTGSRVGHWHPLSWISHMLDVEIFGINPGLTHLENVGFHILNVILLFYLL
ncbi:MAG: hypothetical protein KBC84_09120, partial [Proteobacteria bacterium]|nr:hypothetical protein [Pseudomonadota bacterium]